jgi:hypothetical protein
MSRAVHLHSVVKYAEAVYAQTVDSGALANKEINAVGYDRAAFCVKLGTCKNAGAVLTFTVTNSTRAGGTYALQTGTLHTATAPAQAYTIRTLDVPVDKDRPFLKLLTTAGTGWINASAMVILYNGSRLLPPTQDSTPVVK